MNLRDYLRFEGANSVALGAALVAAAALFGDWEAAWVAVAVAVAGGAAAWWLGRRTVAKAVAGAGDEPAEAPEGAVRREVMVETAIWVVAVVAWVAATGNSAELIAGTGVASAVFGVARASAAAPDGLVVARRGYFRTPRLTRG